MKNCVNINKSLNFILIGVIVIILLNMASKKNNQVTIAATTSTRGFEARPLPFRGNCDFASRFQKCLNDGGYDQNTFSGTLGAIKNNLLMQKCQKSSRVNPKCEGDVPLIPGQLL